MRFPIILLAFLFLTSCKENNIQYRKKSSHPSPIEINTASEKATELKYYKCNYLANQYDTILSAGSKDHITEIWGIDKNMFDNLPMTDKIILDTISIINNAALHIKNRFPGIQLLSTNYTLDRMSDKDTLAPGNWFVKVIFLYDRKGYHQIVPVLPDGRIILSNNE